MARRLISSIALLFALGSRQGFGAIQLQSWGTDQKAGNLLGVQPWLEPKDYLSEAAFAERMGAPLEEAHQKGWLGSRTIVIYPEMIGTWLVASGAPEWSRPWISQASSTSRAMIPIILTRLPSFLREWWNAPASASDAVTHALFASSSREIWKIYSTVFSSLAREYSVTIVAGSLVLPEARTDGSGVLQIGDGPLYNTGVVFSPSGTIQGPLLRKTFTTQDEQTFTACGNSKQAPFFDTPAGKLAVLICADSWFPASYHLIRNRAPLLAVPSFAGTAKEWNSRWKGYSGHKAPDDVDPEDVGRLTEAQAWKKYSMGGRAARAGVNHGMNLFFTGSLWNLHPEGGALVFRGSADHEELSEAGPPTPRTDRIINLWIERKHR